MTDAKSKVAAASTDLLDDLLGIESSSPLSALRSQRSEIAAFIQGSYNALLEPEDEAGVSRLERGLIALRVAILDDSAPLIAHYRAYLAEINAPADLVKATEGPSLAAPLSPRLLAILQHVDRLTQQPGVATPEHLAELQTHGLSAANIVTISQLIAFLSFQVRALVGLQLLGEGL
jgi:CMD domain protein